jgi:probable rRNA maturation factor
MRKKIPATPSPKMPVKPLKRLYPQLEVANQYPALHFDLSKLELFFEVIFSFHRHDVSGELSIAFMDGSAHSDLHGKYLQDYRPTDVITFPSDRENGLAGEICVSVDQAREEAKTRKLSFEHELGLYLIHGWLHLVGFDDLDTVDREIMRMEEQRVIDHVRKLNAWPDFRLASESAEG